MKITHELNIDPEHFEPMSAGRRMHHMFADGTFVKVDDVLRLHEFNRWRRERSGRRLIVRVTYVDSIFADARLPVLLATLRPIRTFSRTKRKAA